MISPAVEKPLRGLSFHTFFVTQVEAISKLTPNFLQNFKCWQTSETFRLFLMYRVVCLVKPLRGQVV